MAAPGLARCHQAASARSFPPGCGFPNLDTVPCLPVMRHAPFLILLKMSFGLLARWSKELTTSLPRRDAAPRRGRPGPHRPEARSGPAAPRSAGRSGAQRGRDPTAALRNPRIPLAGTARASPQRIAGGWACGLRSCGPGLRVNRPGLTLACAIALSAASRSPSWLWQHAMLYRAACRSPALASAGLSLKRFNPVPGSVRDCSKIDKAPLKSFSAGQGDREHFPALEAMSAWSIGARCLCIHSFSPWHIAIPT